MTRPRKVRVYSLAALTLNASVGLRKFGIVSFHASYQRLTACSTARCALSTKVFAPMNVETSESQKPRLKSNVKSWKSRTSLTKSSVGGSSTLMAGGW